MTALKAHEVSRYLKRPDLKAGVFLAYGGDAGLVRETAHTLLRHFEAQSGDPGGAITLEGSDNDAPERLAVEARTPSLFGGTRIIRVRNAGKSLTTALSSLLDEPADAVIVLEAGNLQRNDALRVLIEKSRDARTLPCFADNEEALAVLIRQHFAETQIDIAPDAVATLKSLMGNDREVTRRELEKLSLYAAESHRLTVEDVIVLCGDNAALALDTVIDAAAGGDAARLDEALARAQISGLDSQRILSAALNHFTWLRRLRVEVDAGRPPRDVLAQARPRPHFSRTAGLERQLRLWSDSALSGAAARLYEAVADSRKTGAAGASLAQRALLAVCIAAARH